MNDRKTETSADMLRIFKCATETKLFGIACFAKFLLKESSV